MAGGTLPYADGQIWDGTDANLVRNPKFQAITSPTNNTAIGLIPFTSTTWVALGSSGTDARRTTDAGVTWANPTTDVADMTGPSALSDADATAAISCDHNSANITITTDSGANWTSATTDPANLTNIHSCAFPTATLAVCCGIPSAGGAIYRSTDAGDNWTVASAGPTVETFAVAMLDGTNGFAIDISSNIWTTADGGDNWTDSGQGVTVNMEAAHSSIIPLTSTTGIYLSGGANTNTAILVTFDSTSGSTERLRLNSHTTSGVDMTVTNLVKTTNGNIYFVIIYFTNDSVPSTYAVSANLFRSHDSGVSWTMASLPIFALADETLFDTHKTNVQLVEYDTDKLAFLSSEEHFLKIDMTGDVNAAVTT